MALPADLPTQLYPPTLKIRNASPQVSPQIDDFAEALGPTEDEKWKSRTDRRLAHALPQQSRSNYRLVDPPRSTVDRGSVRASSVLIPPRKTGPVSNLSHVKHALA